jgi:hypothetical protein
MSDWLDLSNPLILYYLFAVLMLPAFINLFRRAGINYIWILPILIPHLGFVAVLGVMAHKTWPNLSDRNGQQDA